MGVVVVGGGVIGAAAAFRLQAAGASVTLIDGARAVEDRASYGNATMIANELAEPLASWPTVRKAVGRLFSFGGPLDFVLGDISLWAPWAAHYLRACRADRFHAGRAALDALCREALPAWRRLLNDVGRTDLLDETPHWAVWETAESLQAGAPAARASTSSAVEVRDLASQEVAAVQREASSKALGGVAFEGSARIRDPGAAVAALREALVARGGQVVSDVVTAVECRDDRIAVYVNGRRRAANLVVVAAGARSAPLVRAAGLKAPLVAERGYHLQYREHDLAPNLPALIFEDRFICVVRAGRNVRITGFTEIGRPGSPPDPRKWAALERHVAELGLPVRGAPERWMGARPSLPDFLPAIGRKGRLLYAFGHQHIGLTLAATTAERVVRLSCRDGRPQNNPFALERFGRRYTLASAQQRFANLDVSDGSGGDRIDSSDQSCRT